MKWSLLVSLGMTLPIYYWLQGEPPTPEIQDELPLTHQQWMESLQSQLKQDPNQSELWFQLGHGYLDNQEFSSALTCFDYAIRLSDKPSANQLAAKATSLYYVRKQMMTQEVVTLLQQSLEMEPDNLTALTLIANDHFISFRYQKAINTWTQILDSNPSGLDRRAIIKSLNKAKQML